MPSKEYRQSLIEKLVEEEFIATQLEISQHLAKQGIKVTQATISRDIQELQLVRIPTGNKQYRYRFIPLAERPSVQEELKDRFQRFVRDIDNGENIIIISTDEGHSSGIAYVIDKLEHSDIVGTIAGQNTIFVVARSREVTEELINYFENLLTN